MISGSLSLWHGASSGCRWKKVLQYGGVSAYILNKQSQVADKGWSSSWGLGRRANNLFVTKPIHVPWIWTDAVVQTKQWKRDIRFGTWSVRKLYRSGSLTTATI
jgi:hypothetical protein